MRIGRVGRPHGVRGVLTVHLDNPGSDVLERVREVVLSGRTGADLRLEVVGAKPRDATRTLLSLSGVSSREDASALVHSTVMVEREALALDPEEFLVSDVLGREVIEDGTVVGRAVSVYHNGAHDVIVVEGVPGCVDFPLVEAHVVGLDAEGRLAVRGFQAFVELSYPPEEGAER